MSDPLVTSSTLAPMIVAASGEVGPSSSTVRYQIIGGSVGAVAGLAALGLLGFLLLRAIRRRSAVPDIVVAGAPDMVQRRGSLPIAVATIGSRRLSLMSVESLVIGQPVARSGSSDGDESDGAPQPSSPGQLSTSTHGPIWSDDSHTNLFPLSRSGSSSAGHGSTPARSPDRTPPVPVVPQVYSSGSDESTVDKPPRPASVSNDPYVDTAGKLRIRNPDAAAASSGATPRVASSPFFGAPRPRLPLRRMPSTVPESPAVGPAPWTRDSGELGGSRTSFEPGTPADIQHVDFGAGSSSADGYFARALGRAL